MVHKTLSELGAKKGDFVLQDEKDSTTRNPFRVLYICKIPKKNGFWEAKEVVRDTTHDSGYFVQDGIFQIDPIKNWTFLRIVPIDEVKNVAPSLVIGIIPT